MLINKVPQVGIISNKNLQEVGSIIGKKGDIVKRFREEVTETQEVLANNETFFNRRAEPKLTSAMEAVPSGS